MTEVRYPFLDLKDANADYLDRLKEAACRVIDSGRYIGGNEVESFNRRLAEFCQAPYAIGVSNGLDALRLIFEAYKIMGRLEPGDEVIIPANTYIATFLAASHAGLTPIAIDPDPLTMNLSAQGVIAAISPRTRAMVTVDLYGRICWDEALRDIVLDRNLLLIEDAAQSIGARASLPGLFGSHEAGAIGHAGAFSFYPTKNVGALGDAGAVITHDPTLADIVKALANYGSDRRYHNLYIGFNCRLDPIQAAMLSVKISDVNAVNNRRRRRAEIYSAEINNPLVATPQMPANPAESVWHQYVVRVADGRRNELRDYLADNGVETDIHYPAAPHQQPCYASASHRDPVPLTDRLTEEILSLPIGDSTSIERGDPQAIARIINRFK